MGAAVEMLIICELCKRFFLSGNRNKRFGLGTLLLVMTGLLIYLPLFREIYHDVPRGTDGLTTR